MGFWLGFAEMLDKASGRLLEFSQASLLKGEILWLSATLEEGLQKVGEEVVGHWQMAVISPEVQRLVAQYHLATVVRCKKEEELKALQEKGAKPTGTPKLQFKTSASLLRDYAKVGVYGPQGKLKDPYPVESWNTKAIASEEIQENDSPVPKTPEDLREDIENQGKKAKTTLQKIGRLYVQNRYFADMQPFTERYILLDKAIARLELLEDALARLHHEDIST